VGERNYAETGIVRRDDIVIRLLQRCVGGGMTDQVMRDAAAEIEQLRIAYRQAMNTLEQATDEIERLRVALRLAAVEVFGHCDPTTTSPDQLVQHFIEESAVADTPAGRP
jgi:hypothetical protein